MGAVVPLSERERPEHLQLGSSKKVPLVAQATGWIVLPDPYRRWQMPSGTDIFGPGVYCWWDGERSYVGMASNLWSRLADHRRAGALTERKNGVVYPTASVAAAARLERSLIWLLAPTENASRPAPPLEVWAGSLGHERPVIDEEWNWQWECGHVVLGPRTLASAEDVAEAGCDCRPLRWEPIVKAYVERMERERDEAVEAAAAAAERIDDLEKENQMLASPLVPTRSDVADVLLQTIEDFGGAENIPMARRLATVAASRLMITYWDD